MEETMSKTWNHGGNRKKRIDVRSMVRRVRELQAPMHEAARKARLRKLGVVLL